MGQIRAIRRDVAAPITNLSLLNFVERADLAFYGQKRTAPGCLCATGRRLRGREKIHRRQRGGRRVGCFGERVLIARQVKIIQLAPAGLLAADWCYGSGQRFHCDEMIIS